MKDNSQLIERLEKNALWIIMDPWYPHPVPKDVEDHPDIDERNLITLEAIADYLPRLQHVVVSNVCAKVYPRLNHIPNVKDNIEKIDLIINEHQIEDIVWTGLHHGRCILGNQLGVKLVSDEYSNCNCWIKKDLVCTFPADSEWEMDRLSSNFATLI